MPLPLLRFLGITFWNGSAEDLLFKADREGGLLTVPSAPSLAQMQTDPLLAGSYQNSDFAVVDGGYVALILRFVFGKRIKRISGLQILQKLTSPAHSHVVPMEKRTILWVVPNGEEQNAVRNYLLEGGFDLNRQHFYHAPIYRTDADYSDGVFFSEIQKIRPDWVVLCIGGGRQEKLGWYCRTRFDELERKPVILCTGGAICFLTGTQANIPTWADRLYLGWLLRVVQNPRTFFPRYFRAAWQFPCLLWSCRRELFGSGPIPVSTRNQTEI
jgi:N-acetylglucosaminyldiphosphoundecaprenol N-acetyl-beta-D-mannosaminyltransferase